MAEPIVNAGCRFEHVFCSIATRAQLTIEGISRALPDSEIQWKLEEALYTFSGHSLLDWCLDQDDGLDEMVLVGHNPAMTMFCNGMGNRQIENMPTCGYAQLVFPQDSWLELTPGSGKTVSFLTPKQFR
jgi:phosphohistidine phosphatase